MATDNQPIAMRAGRCRTDPFGLAEQPEYWLRFGFRRSPDDDGKWSL